MVATASESTTTSGIGSRLGFRLFSAMPPTATYAFTALAGLAMVVIVFLSASRVRLKSPWPRKKRKHALSPQRWRSLFTLDGKLQDGGVKFFKKDRSGGIDPRIMVEVWPFLLGVHLEKLQAKDCWPSILMCGSFWIVTMIWW